MTTTTTSIMEAWLEKNEPKTYANFINGEWVQSPSGEIFSVYNSSNQEQLIARFQDSSEEDVDMAVHAANEAFKSWSKVPGPDRASILFKFADLLEKNIEELSYMLSAEQGKVLAESKGEVLRAAKEVRFCAGEASRVEGKTLPGERSNVWNSTVRKPIGVIAAIAAWNFPVVTPIRKIAPALAYGCTVVYKPASVTPWTSIRLMELFAEAGVPNGVVNLVVGSGLKVGTPLVKHPLIKGISFTGSTKMGIQINEIAAKRLARTQLELGGKNPAVVLSYDDVESVARQISGAAFTCSGQRCTAISRVVVLKEKQKEFIEALLTEVKKINVGPAWDDEATMGPLVNQDHLESVQEYVQNGILEGGTLLFGGDILTDGKYKKGAYMLPAVFTDVTSNMRIAKEEIFGPVLMVIAVENKEEAFIVANDVDYGLASSIFTKDLSEAYQFADQVEAGMVHVNHGTASAAHLPFGGTKQSGFGAFSIGSSNVDFFTVTKAVYFQY
jgi:acyl-CoA reductase-like NAD-dependent aldehyde dehydrogenase